MKKKNDNDDLIHYDYLSKHEDDLVVERHPRNKLPLLSIAIICFLFISYHYLTQLENSSSISERNISSIKPSEKKLKKTVPEQVNFHQLIADGNIMAVQEQLHEIDIKKLNEVVNGMTPIMLAAAKGHVEMIDLLFTQGADPNKRGAMQRTALQYAIDKNHIEAAKRLLVYGADIDAYDNGQLTPLVMAANRGHSELALYLVEEGADVNIPQAQGWTALINATAHNDEKLVKALLKSGADRDHKASNGKKAMDYAQEYGFPNMVKILSK